MLKFILLAVTPLVVRAYQQAQTPLINHEPKFVVPLQLDDQRNYYFQSTFSDIRHLELKALEDIVSYGATDFHPHAISIYIPLDPKLPGTMSLIPTTPESFQYTSSQLNWIDTKTPGDDMPISHVGIRKGGSISAEAYDVRLALETPYISIPSDIYDVLVLATNPKPEQSSFGYDDVVDCNNIGRFPDLFIGLDPEEETPSEESAEVEDREIVITPSQYIMESEPGRCVLLAKRAYYRDSEEVVLGWAAIRGRHVVLDWINERTGFEI